MPHALIVDDDPTSRSALADLIDHRRPEVAFRFIGMPDPALLAPAH